jgi:putative RNA 2'-phosphotransferase
MSNQEKISKYLSYILRHAPQSIQVSMDSEGWVDIDELMTNALTFDEVSLTLTEIIDVVVSSDKQRFKLSADQTKIRANQGHSIQVELDLVETVPPEILYHGTAHRFVDSIQQEGLKPMARQHVHLSADIETAINVGSRYGKPVILTITAQQMYQDGVKFYLSENSVWLVDAVTTQYIQYGHH